MYILANIGLLAVMAGLAIPLLNGGFTGHLYLWVYSAGALMALVGRALARAPRSAPMRVRRLVRMQVWSALFFCTAAVLAWLQQGTMRDFMALTLAGAAVQIVASVMLGREAGRGGNS